MRKHIACLGASLLFATSFSALADDVNYTYAQALYTVDGTVELSNNQGDSQTSDLGGFQLTGSVGLSDHIIGRLQFSEISIDKLGSEYRFFSVGVGGHFSLGSDWYKIDLFGLVSYETIQGGNFDYDASGYGVRAGFRWQPIANIEILPFFEYYDYGKPDKASSTVEGSSYGVQAVYSFTDAFAITARYQANNFELMDASSNTTIEFGDQISVGIRYYMVSDSGPSVF